MKGLIYRAYTKETKSESGCSEYLVYTNNYKTVKAINTYLKIIKAINTYLEYTNSLKNNFIKKE